MRDRRPMRDGGIGTIVVCDVSCRLSCSALPRPSIFSEVIVRPSFFLSAPDMAPLTV